MFIIEVPDVGGQDFVFVTVVYKPNISVCLTAGTMCCRKVKTFNYLNIYKIYLKKYIIINILIKV